MLFLQMYYVVVNGNLAEYSEYKKWLKQGHPIFHYLFVICVVVWTRLLDAPFRNLKSFHF